MATRVTAGSMWDTAIPSDPGTFAQNLCESKDTAVALAELSTSAPWSDGRSGATANRTGVTMSSDRMGTCWWNLYDLHDVLPRFVSSDGEADDQLSFPSHNKTNSEITLAAYAFPVSRRPGRVTTLRNSNLHMPNIKCQSRSHQQRPKSACLHFL